MKKWILSILMCMASIIASAQGFTERIERDGLVIYIPHFSRVDLVCGTMPKQADTSVIFCAEAAYTEKLETTFSHINIDGNHVSAGVFYEGTPCDETPQKIGNTGAFVWYEGIWQFVRGDASDALHTAAAHGGAGFCQAIVYWEGTQQSTTRGTIERFRKKTTHYRVLAELNGQLCIIDSRDAVPYEKFLSLLEQLKPTYAIYCDMGYGWNYSWYRNAKGRTHEIHPTPGQYTTNWITFYK